MLDLIVSRPDSSPPFAHSASEQRKTAKGPTPETPLRVVVGVSGPSAPTAVLVVTEDDEGKLSTEDGRLAALLPTTAVLGLAREAKAFRGAYRQILFAQAQHVGALVAAHREAPLLIECPATENGRAVAAVLDEFFAAWAPC